MAKRPMWRAVLLAVPMTLLVYVGAWILLFAFLGDLLAHAMGFKAIVGALGGGAFGYAVHRWVVMPVQITRLKQRTPPVPT